MYIAVATLAVLAVVGLWLTWPHQGTTRLNQLRGIPLGFTNPRGRHEDHPSATEPSRLLAASRQRADADAGANGGTVKRLGSWLTHPYRKFIELCEQADSGLSDEEVERRRAEAAFPMELQA